MLPEVTKHVGSVLDSVGDSCLTSFPSVMELLAVQPTGLRAETMWVEPFNKPLQDVTEEKGPLSKL